ncbi:MAG: pyridoxal phosphate-dependent aminotransferase family protein [Asgard group archaeon]|nr:pyridoxal phosphate-dependent aminotransferase family protein [Asgard group archaeon]
MNFFNKYIKKTEETLLPQITFAKEMGFYPYFKKLCSEQGPVVQMNGKKVIMLGSNNYLGMTNNSKVKAAAKQAIDEFGVGSTGSRLLNGTMNLHVELEHRLADFFNKESAVVFSTGMQANLGALSCFLNKDDWVISDQQNHASIIDGIRLGKIKRDHKLIYNHCDMEDLERCLKKVPKDERALIVTDGVFSMEGDVAPLKEITDLAETYEAGVYVDDAHSVGVLGENGRGTANHFGVEDKVDVIMGTFSKSFASIGGYIAASEELCTWVRHQARSFIFSASGPPAAMATVLAVLDIIENDDSIRKRLWKNTKKMKQGYQEIGFNIGNSETPIIPIIIGDEQKTFMFAKQLMNETPISVYTNPVRPPATPPGRELIRTSCLATLQEDTIDNAISILSNNAASLEIV